MDNGLEFFAGFRLSKDEFTHAGPVHGAGDFNHLWAEGLAYGGHGSAPCGSYGTRDAVRINDGEPKFTKDVCSGALSGASSAR